MEACGKAVEVTQGASKDQGEEQNVHRHLSESAKIAVFPLIGVDPGKFLLINEPFKRLGNVIAQPPHMRTINPLHPDEKEELQKVDRDEYE